MGLHASYSHEGTKFMDARNITPNEYGQKNANSSECQDLLIEMV